MEIIKFKIHDIVELKKPHPCGNKQFEILRIGSEIRIVCLACGRDLVMDRIKLERATKKLIHSAEQEGGVTNESNK